MSANPRVVIIGRGWGINIQVPAFKHAGWDVEAVVTRSETDLSNSDAYKLVHDSQLETVLNSPMVKLVTIVSPPKTHAKYFQTVNEVNKQRTDQSHVHVLCEKPFAMDLAEAMSMTNQLRQTQLASNRATNQSLKKSINQFAPYGWIDHELRCLQAVKKARDFINSASFGPVHNVTILHLGSLAVKPAYSWWNDSAQRGGVLGAVGSHMIDLCHFLTDSSIVKVNGQLQTAVPDKIDPATNQSKTATSDDYASFTGMALSNQSATSTHTFPVSITVTSNAGGFLSRKTCIIAGRNQSLELDLETLIVTAWVEGKKQILSNGEDYIDSEVEKIKLPKNPFAAGTVLIARRLREIVLSSSPMADPDLATFEDGIKVQAVMDAVYQSAETGNTVDVTK